MNLIILHPGEVVEGCAVLSDGRALHIRKVLKAEVGKKLRIGLLNGPLGTGTVRAIDLQEVTLGCAFEESVSRPPMIDLLLAMPRPKVLKRLWAQLSALGVGRIVLMRAEKVERYYFDSHVIDPDYYTERLIEGLQQARCTHMPEVLVRPLFKPFVEDELEGLFNHHIKLLADPSGEKRLSDFQWNEKRVLLAIGPEGGWTPYELDRLKEHGFEVFGMGNRILRTDTATIGIMGVLNDRLDEN